MEERRNKKKDKKKEKKKHPYKKGGKRRCENMEIVNQRLNSDKKLYKQ